MKNVYGVYIIKKPETSLFYEWQHSEWKDKKIPHASKEGRGNTTLQQTWYFNCSVLKLRRYFTIYLRKSTLEICRILKYLE
jgi:hypothetical protein